MRFSLAPAALEHNAEGEAWSALYGDRYASRDGALGQARHVFLGGNDLPQRWQGQRQFVIVETGFGLGVNFLATWQAWSAQAGRPEFLHYVALERHPVSAADLRGLADPATPGGYPPELRANALQLAAQWPLALPGLHRLEFEGGRVLLTLGLGDARSLADELELGADAFYLDGFAPDRNPDMWDPYLLRALARLARPGSTAASYTCARAVREGLGDCGFEVTLAPGFGAKREMLRARYQPRWKMRRHEPPAPYAGERRALVIGAGLAGCASAYALRRRGWSVTVLERAAAPAAGASGLPAGLLQPLLSADDNLVSQLTRAGFLFGRSLLERLQARLTAQDAAGERLWAACGVYRQSEDDNEDLRLRAALPLQGAPQAYARQCTPQEAEAALGMRAQGSGTWFGLGGVVAMGRWCRVLLEAHGATAGARPRQALHETPAGTQAPDALPGAGVQAADALHEAPGGTQAADALHEAPGGTRAPDALHEAPGGARAPDALFGFDVRSIAYRDGLWQAIDAQGRTLQAPVLVLANAGGLLRLAPSPGLELEYLGGMVSLLQAPAFSGLRAGLSGDGYCIPPLVGMAGIGATYEDPVAVTSANADGAAPMPTGAALAADHASNLARAPRLLAQAPALAVAGSFYAQRCVAPDRVPLAGALVDVPAVLAAAQALRGAHLADLPRLPGLYCVAALGSRGLSLGPILGEHVAALINGEPPPLHAALSAAVDPGRFLLRQLRTAAVGTPPGQADLHAAAVGTPSKPGQARAANLDTPPPG